jgi:hypothetical protein
VTTLIAEAVAGPEMQRRLEAAVDRMFAPNPDAEKAAERERAAMADAEKWVQRIVAAVAKGVFGHDEARAQIDAARTARREHEERLAEFEEIARVGPARAGEVAAVRATILEAAELFDQAVRAAVEQGDVADARSLVSAWLERATFDKRTRELEVVIRPFPVGLTPSTLEARG